MALKIFGRIHKKRSHKAAQFYDLYINGIDKIQVIVKGELIDHISLGIGDVVEFSGDFGYSKRSSYSFFAQTVRKLASPEKIIPFGKNSKNATEQMIVSDKLRILRSRFSILQDIRSYYLNNLYMEVQTPIIQPIYGGATATPFKTHCRSVDKQMFLRISPELYLKRFIVAGFPKVFEIAKVFRNEGMDHTHHPEFTICEAYEAGTTLNDWINFTKSFLNTFVYKYLNYFPKFIELNSSAYSEHHYEKEVQLELKKYPDYFVFVLGSPKYLSPLAKQGLNDNPNISKSFELYFNGIELINCYEEENGADLQLEKLESIGKNNPIDKEYIDTLRLGMPPTTGWGLGVDRLIMILLKKTKIADVLPYPQTGRK
eukprot:NODE_109_length_18665_cov_0.924486.p6 type:complete len:371 gc:universal NODE_109_length_18665_cov_0.924486:3942-2830(-)